MALNAWQKITRVLPGKPFGDGKDGDYSSSSIPTMTRQSCSGSANSTTLSLGAAGFTNGDIVLIHQTRGTGAGQWEINQVSSGGGTTSLTLKVALKYTYTDSGASQAQVVKIPRYKNVTVPSGATWTVPGWDGNVGGILAFACNGVFTPTGTISANSAGHSGGGGGLVQQNSNAHGVQGEGTGGAGARGVQSANGSGGGAGLCIIPGYGGGGGGGGGGNGVAGSAGGDIWASNVPGSAGSSAGSSDLIKMALGGGGAGGGADAYADSETSTGGAGGKGAGIVLIIGKTINAPTSIVSNGANGSNAGTVGGSYRHAGGGGGGAGGSILIMGHTVNIGTNKLSTTAGAGGAPSRSEGNNGGAGGKGRIAVYYGKSLSGSVSSTYYGTLTTEKDTGLVEAQGVGTYWFV